MPRVLLSSKIDFVFKKIFGNEKHPEILISFLNAVMEPTDPIKSVQIKNSDIEKEHIEDKYSRLDIKAITNSGEYINVEIQLKNEYNMIKRSLYYWSKLYEEQIVQGDNYEKLAKTVCINILDFKYLKNDRYHNAYRLKEIETNEQLTDIMEIHFIEIPKLKKVENSEEITDMLTAWVEFISNPEGDVIANLEMCKKEIREAKEELVRLSANSRERMLYEKRKESLLNKTSAIIKATEEGRAEGRAEGIEEGKKEEKIKNVKSFLLLGVDLETIAKGAGISIEEVIKIKEEM